MERFRVIDNLQHLQESLFDNRLGIIELAKEYTRILGLDPASTFSNTENPEFWDPEYLDETGVNPGMHVRDSLRCLVDFERTNSLLAGIQKTVESMKKEGHLNIVGIDAGTGSGILAMGLVAAGCEKVYALEINPATVSFARQFINKHGFEDKIGVIQCDATKVKISGLTNVDILVSENLATGLFDEPQYQIIRNLSEYLGPDAKIVPFSSTLFASLGWANWEDMGEEKFTLVNKLRDRVQASGLHPYMEVVSRSGMEIPHIFGETKISIQDHSFPINTLFISTRFQVDDTNNPIILEPDSAEFLGKTSAFRLPSSIQAESGVVNFRANYQVGYRSKLSTIRIDKNLITLESPKA